MIIGIDIDDTINDLAKILIKYARKYNKEENIEHIIQENEWNFDKAFGWDEENIRKFLGRYMRKAFFEAKPKKQAVEIINKFKEEQNTIVIITARNKEHVFNIYEVTEKWLKENNIKYDKLIVDGKDKVEDCKKNNIDVFIDDSIYNCEKVYETLNIPVYIFDSKYNQKKVNKNIKRVFSWEEIYEQIHLIDLCKIQ